MSDEQTEPVVEEEEYDVEYHPPTEEELATSKDIAFTELVNEVLRGEWGEGQDRRLRLSEAGHDHRAVQQEIVRRMNA